MSSEWWCPTLPTFSFRWSSVELRMPPACTAILCDSEEDREEERRHLNTLFSRRVDGVLIACSDPSTAYDRLMRRRFPIVFFDRIPRGLTHNGVSTDNVEAGYRATSHLI